MLKRLLNVTTHRLHTLPILVLMPHSRCNCRCLMCDIWKANSEKKEISTAELERHIAGFKKLNVRRVALSGGEALMHSNLWKLCEMLRSIEIKISLLSTGITLKNHAREIVQHCDDVVVSLDGSREIHNRIRNIPGAFEKLAEGVAALKLEDSGFRVTARTVLQKENFLDFPGIIKTARELKLDQISFLAADVSSHAFNRPDAWENTKVTQVALEKEQVDEFQFILEKSFIDFKPEFDSHFIAESPQKLLELCQYYRGLYDGNFPRKHCNAPWVSAVVEPDGNVLPCFFHEPYGNLYNRTLEEVINSPAAITFRKQLKINDNPTCQRCVCSLHVGLTQEV